MNQNVQFTKKVKTHTNLTCLNPHKYFFSATNLTNALYFIGPIYVDTSDHMALKYLTTNIYFYAKTKCDTEIPYTQISIKDQEKSTNASWFGL